MPHPVVSQSRRLRTGRFSEPGRVYLLTSTVHNRQPLFGDFILGRLLIAELRAAHEQGWVASLAWVVMPDHLHWLVELEGRSLDELMRRIKSNSARRINRRLGGPVRFGRKAITTGPCARTTTCKSPLAMSWPIRCGRGWLIGSETTRIGMRFGCRVFGPCGQGERSRSRTRRPTAPTLGSVACQQVGLSRSWWAGS